MAGRVGPSQRSAYGPRVPGRSNALADGRLEWADAILERRRGSVPSRSYAGPRHKRNWIIEIDVNWHCHLGQVPSKMALSLEAASVEGSPPMEPR